MAVAPSGEYQSSLYLSLALIEHAHYGNDFPCELCAQHSGDMSRIIKVITIEQPYVVTTFRA